MAGQLQWYHSTLSFSHTMSLISSKAWVIIAAFSFATTGFLATASRMTWAFAREKGLPGSSFLSRVRIPSSHPLRHEED